MTSDHAIGLILMVLMEKKTDNDLDLRAYPIQILPHLIFVFVLLGIEITTVDFSLYGPAPAHIPSIVGNSYLIVYPPHSVGFTRPRQLQSSFLF